MNISERSTRELKKKTNKQTNKKLGSFLGFNWIGQYHSVSFWVGFIFRLYWGVSLRFSVATINTNPIVLVRLFQFYFFFIFFSPWASNDESPRRQGKGFLRFWFAFNVLNATVKTWIGRWLMIFLFYFPFFFSFFFVVVAVIFFSPARRPVFSGAADGRHEPAADPHPKIRIRIRKPGFLRVFAAAVPSRAESLVSKSLTRPDFRSGPTDWPVPRNANKTIDRSPSQTQPPPPLPPTWRWLKTRDKSP